MLGATLRWTSTPSRGSGSTPSRFMLLEPKTSPLVSLGWYTHFTLLDPISIDTRKEKFSCKSRLKYKWLGSCLHRNWTILSTQNVVAVDQHKPCTSVKSFVSWISSSMRCKKHIVSFYVVKQLAFYDRECDSSVFCNPAVHIPLISFLKAFYTCLSRGNLTELMVQT